MIKVERVRSFDQIPQARWNALFKSSAGASIFQTYEFQSIWWRHFGANNDRRELLLLLATDNGDLLGIAPLMVEQIRLLGRRRIKFIGTPVSDYMDFIIAQGKEKQVLRCFLAYLRQAPRWIELELVFVPEGSALLKLPDITKAVIDKSPYIQISGDWPKTYQELSKTIKKYVARRQRTIERLGKVELGSVKNHDQIDEFLTNYFRIHVKRWRDFQGRYSHFQYQHWQSFVREISAVFFSRGWLDLSYLRLNSDIIACHFGFVYNKVFHWYMPAFNPDYSRFSPGILLIMQLLEQSAVLGLEEFDFLRGEELYKMMWTERIKNLYRCLAYPDRVIEKRMGRSLRRAKDFYAFSVKNRIKLIRPLMKAWYKIKQRAGDG